MDELSIFLVKAMGCMACCCVIFTLLVAAINKATSFWQMGYAIALYYANRKDFKKWAAEKGINL